MKQCCETMEQQINDKCSTHGDNCPEKAVRLYKNGNYGIPLHDGSYIQINVCPFCGAMLPKQDIFHEIELNAGNIELGNELMNMVRERAHQIVNNVKHAKTGYYYNSDYEFGAVTIVGNNKMVEVAMTYKRPHDIDDHWDEEFPIELLYDNEAFMKYLEEVKKNERNR